MQQNGVQCAYKYMYHKAVVQNCHFTQYYYKYSTQSKSQWLHGEHTHTQICYQFTFLAGSKDLNLVSKK